MDNQQNCGNCKWWRPEGMRIGRCKHEKFSKPIPFIFDPLKMTTYSTEGEQCQCYTKKETT